MISILTILPFSITGLTCGFSKFPILANRNSASVSTVESYKPVIVLGSVS